MKAVILAAGRGNRMGGLTDQIPKCLVKLGGTPLLHWQIAALRRAGIDEIAVVKGYNGAKIDRRDLHYFENDRWERTNMVMSLVCATSWLESDSCLVSYADIVYHYRIVERLAVAKGDVTITYDREWLKLWKMRFADPLADAETFRVDRDGRLVEIGGKTTKVEDIQGQYMGLLKFTPRGWEGISDYLESISPEERDRLDMTSLIRRLLGRGMAIDTVAVDGGWCEVDSANDLELYQNQTQELIQWHPEDTGSCC